MDMQMIRIFGFLSMPPYPIPAEPTVRMGLPSMAKVGKLEKFMFGRLKLSYLETLLSLNICLIPDKKA